MPRPGVQPCPGGASVSGTMVRGARSADECVCLAGNEFHEEGQVCKACGPGNTSVWPGGPSDPSPRCAPDPVLACASLRTEWTGTALTAAGDLPHPIALWAAPSGLPLGSGLPVDVVVEDSLTRGAWWGVSAGLDSGLRAPTALEGFREMQGARFTPQADAGLRLFIDPDDASVVRCTLPSAPWLGPAVVELSTPPGQGHSARFIDLATHPSLRHAVAIVEDTDGSDAEQRSVLLFALPAPPLGASPRKVILVPGADGGWQEDATHGLNVTQLTPPPAPFRPQSVAIDPTGTQLVLGSAPVPDNAGVGAASGPVPVLVALVASSPSMYAQVCGHPHAQIRDTPALSTALVS